VRDRALRLGVHDVTVLTHRSVPAVAAPIAPARLVHYEPDPQRPSRPLALNRTRRTPVADFLAGHDIVVNCITPHSQGSRTECGGSRPG
jgi:hypothetical protein